MQSFLPLLRAFAIGTNMAEHLRVWHSSYVAAASRHHVAQPVFRHMLRASTQKAHVQEMAAGIHLHEKSEPFWMHTEQLL